VADRLVGTLVHRLFQRDSMLADRDALLARARTLLTPAELADADEGDLPRAVEAFLALRDREDVSQLLSSGERFFEVPFSYRPEGEPAAIIRGTIDCLIVRPAGAVIVVEFKTGRPRPEHERQVATYVAALCAAWPGRAVESRLVYASDIG
jgi:ATP-dependent exoDNAse (exonuclease V) beta subunit